MIEAFKKNALDIAKHHRKHCEGKSCNISLNILAMMAECCGVVFTFEERGEFA